MKVFYNRETVADSLVHLHFVHFVARKIQFLLLFVQNEYMTMIAGTFDGERL